VKIGLVAPGGFDRSGRERVVPVFLWLVERLARHHEVHVFTLYQHPQPCQYPLLGATVHNVGASGRPLRIPRTILRTLRVLGREHARRPFDVLHGLWAGESGFSAVTAGRILRVPSVLTVAGGELVALADIGYGALLHRRGRWLVRATLRLATAVTAATEFMRQPLRPYRPDAELIPLGVDTALFAPAVSPLGPPWRLLHVASLNRVKDQTTLLRAMQVVHAAAPTAHLDIIGEDTLGGAMQRLARDLGLEQAVTFRGFQPSDTVSAALRQSHLLLHSSRHESGPIVFLEAAACGVPALGTAVGHFADLAPTAAVAVPVGDAAALAQATLDLLRDPVRRQAVGEQALAWARAHDADWTAAQFAALYARLVASRL
jgi:glycosyltransferase involved in cell wall biosynthesis